MDVLYIANRPKYCHNLMQGLAWATKTWYIRIQKKELSTQNEDSMNFSSEFLSKSS